MDNWLGSIIAKLLDLYVSRVIYLRSLSPEDVQQENATVADMFEFMILHVLLGGDDAPTGLLMLMGAVTSFMTVFFVIVISHIIVSSNSSSQMPKWLSFGFHSFLYFYPKSFRQEHREDMYQCFINCCADKIEINGQIMGLLKILWDLIVLIGQGLCMRFEQVKEFVLQS